MLNKSAWKKGKVMDQKKKERKLYILRKSKERRDYIKT